VTQRTEESVLRTIKTARASSDSDKLSVYGRIVRALLTGQPVRSRDAERFDRTPALVGMVVKELRSVGVDIEVRDGVYVAVTDERGWKIKPRPSTWLDDSTNLEVVPAIPVENETASQRHARRVRADLDELAHLRSFHRDAPVCPPLGTVTRVSMVAEDDGHAVLVLSTLTGDAKWFVRVEGAQTS